MVMSPLARSPLHFWHVTHNVRLVQTDGWQLPAGYTDIEVENRAVRTGLAIADISAFSKRSLQGQGVSALTRALLGDGPASRPRGVALLTTGSPVLACRLTDDHLLVLGTTTAGFGEERLDDLCREHAVVGSDATSAYAGFWLLGPGTDDLLRSVTSFDIGASSLPVGTCAQTSLAGVHALLVRPPRVPPTGVQVYVSWDVAEYTWERLFEVGHSLSITPIGLEACSLLLRAAS
jgi:glycine cleavage system aminomethyltransferase T